MSKMKTKSGAKKRFRKTSTGLLTYKKAGKRHGMIKRTNKFIRNSRSRGVVSSNDEAKVNGFLPYI